MSSGRVRRGGIGRGAGRYSSQASGPTRPSEMPRPVIAEVTATNSSRTAGMKRSTTAAGMTSCRGSRSRSSAAISSPTRMLTTAR